MSSLRVLHVDDEPDIREVVEMSLALDPQLAVKSCSCGSDALSAAADWSPDLILMDVMMPQMDGPQTLSHLRESRQTAQIPVVFMTARAQTRELAHFLSLGAAGVIPKPFDPMTLAGSVRDYLKNSAISLDGLRAKFVKRAAVDVMTLGELRGRLLAEPAAVCGEVATLAHALTGAAGTHGFAAVSEQARAVEDAVEGWRGGKMPASEIEEKLGRLLRTMAREIPAAEH